MYADIQHSKPMKSAAKRKLFNVTHINNAIQVHWQQYITNQVIILQGLGFINTSPLTFGALY